MESRSICVDGLEAQVVRKRIKHIYLRVKPPDGRIEVSAPKSAPLSAICDFIRSKRSWIERQKIALEDSKMRDAEQASDEEKREWKAVVSSFVPPLIERWQPIMGVRAEKVVYRNMKSRWGSCQPATGVICINTRLALYPPECLEYVVVHELCHLLERGHGPRFRALMDSFLPDWRLIRAKLR